MTFQDCVMECAKTPELVKEFNRLSDSHLFVDTRSSLEKMIDEATGFQLEVARREHEAMQKFLDFVFACVWIPLIFGDSGAAR